MAILFLEKRKFQSYLSFIFFILILVTGLLLWRGYFSKNETLPPSEITTASSFPKIEINFDTFKNPFLEKLQPFEKIPPFEEKIGRDNPFIPY